MNKDFAKGMIVSLALKSLPVRKKSPIAYLYNGVRLPALPEWDREKYPYAFMYYGTTLIGKAYKLCVSAEIVYNGSTIGVSGGYKTYNCLENDPTKWTYAGNGDDSKRCDIASVMWANFDVLGEDGSVVLSGSDPIPIYNEPVNYLYNGVQLPKLPEWDKTVYPYAVLYIRENQTEYTLAVTANPMTCNESGNLNVGIYGIPTGSSSGEYSNFKTEDGAWVEGSKNGITAAVAVWTNSDLYYDADAGGGLFMAASNPVPVYE